MSKKNHWQTIEQFTIDYGSFEKTYAVQVLNVFKVTLLQDAEMRSLPEGSLLKIKGHSRSKDVTLRSNCIVAHQTDGTTAFIFLSTFDVQAPRNVERSHVLKLEPFDSFLQGGTSQPWFLGAKFKFKVTEVFKDGFTITYPIRPHNILLPGMQLELKMPNDRSGFSLLLCEVASTVSEDEQGISDVRIVKGNRKGELRSFYHQLMAHYSNINLDHLRLIRAPLPNFRENIRISLAQNPKEVDLCLGLRQLAYTQKKNSRLSGDLPLSAFTDEFDQKALILRFSYFYQTAGTARIILRSDASEIRTLTSIPDFIMDGGFLEVSRLATHPNYRGRDLFVLVLQTVLKFGLLLNKKYVIFDCEDHLLPVYKKIGGKVIPGAEIVHPMENVRLNLIYAPVEEAITGKNLPFGLYLFGLIPLHKHLIDTGSLKASRLQSLKVGLLFSISRFLLKFDFLDRRR